MDARYTIMPYEINIMYINKSMQPVFHDGVKWGNELVIVLDGEGDFRVDEQVFAVRRGDIFVLRNDYWREVTNARNMRLCSIYYREESMNRLAGCYVRLVGYQSLFIRNSYARAYQPKDRLQADDYLLEKLEYYIGQMQLEHKLKEEGCEQILNSLFFTVLTLISRAMNNRPYYSETAEMHFLQTVAHMQENLGETMSLDDLAKMAHMSKRHFDRKFLQIYQCSPLRFLTTLRLNRACVLLEETDLTITEIAGTCGFSDINYFSANFKKMKQMSPTAYRSNYRSNLQMSTVQRYSPKIID